MEEILFATSSPCCEQSIDRFRKVNVGSKNFAYFHILDNQGNNKLIENKPIIVKSDQGFYGFRYLYLHKQNKILIGIRSKYNNSDKKLLLLDLETNKLSEINIIYNNLINLFWENEKIVLINRTEGNISKITISNNFKITKKIVKPILIKYQFENNFCEIDGKSYNGFIPGKLVDNKLNFVTEIHKDIDPEKGVWIKNTFLGIRKINDQNILFKTTFTKNKSINPVLILILSFELIFILMYYYFRQILFLPFVSGESSYAVLYKILGSLYYWKIYGKLSFYRFPKNISRKNEKFYFLLKDLTTDYKEVYNRKSPILQIKLFQLNTQNELLLVQRIAHDIKNQVHLMNLQISDFDELTDSYNPSSSKELIKQIKPSLKDMYKKTLLLSGFSKLFDLNIREIDLSILLENLIMEFMYHPKFNQIKFKNIENSFWIEIDENLFLIALRNLIENALQYSCAESEILIELRILENEYEILIQNQGSISDKIIEKILAGSKSASSSGSGVGFLISKKIIENINGKCEISSNRNNVVVSIILPVKLNLEKVK